MKITLERTDSDFALEAKNEDGNTVTMDASKEIGGQGKGMRPMQLLLSALGSCSAIDMIQILKKQKQHIRRFRVEIEGLRENIDNYALFKVIDLHFWIEGDVEQDKAEKAAKLSFEKYCSVAKTLEPTATLNYKVTVNQYGTHHTI